MTIENSESDETTITVTSAAPSVAAALKRAAQIADEHGRAWFCVEDLVAALLEGDRVTPLSFHWERRGLGALTYEELRELAVSIVPGPTRSDRTPQRPATVTFSATGPHAAEFVAHVDAVGRT